jgi:GTP-binding protein
MSSFLDYVEIYLKSGTGGNGAIAFLREALNPKGGPAGGNGGSGGDVIIRSDKNIRSLYRFKYIHHLKAENGKHGGNNNKSGGTGKNLVITIPVGTVIYDEEKKLIYDFKYDNETIVLLKGGRGGLGNNVFKSSTRQHPRFALKGELGNEKKYIFELKILADIAIVGFPNAGKSTLISHVSNAKPKIADYPFTTLTPHQGIVFLENGMDYVIADIPGLIEGAHIGKGLGYKFLKHIERCRVVLYLLDPTNQELGDVKKQYDNLRYELAHYKKELVLNPYLIAVNKIDRLEKEIIEQIKDQFGEEIFFVSARERLNLKPLIYKLGDILKSKPVEVEKTNIKKEIYEIEPDIGSIDRLDRNKYIIKGKIVRMIDQIDFNQSDALYYFQRFLKKKGIDKILKKNGIQDGDIIIIADHKFTYYDEE